MTSDADKPDTAHRAADARVAEIIGRLSTEEDADRAERARMLGRLATALGASARQAGAVGVAGGRWLVQLFEYIAPRIPVRDLDTLRHHYHGLTGEALADALVAAATRGTTGVGAAGGALAAAQFTAPPLLLSAPVQLVAETLAVAAIEVKLIAELHEVYGVQVQGTGTQRAAAFTTSWAKRRGVDPLAPGSVTLALGSAAKKALRKRLMRTFGRHVTTLGPFLTGAIAGGTLNRMVTQRLADAVRSDLRNQ